MAQARGALLGRPQGAVKHAGGGTNGPLSGPVIDVEPAIEADRRIPAQHIEMERRPIAFDRKRGRAISRRPTPRPRAHSLT